MKADEIYEYFGLVPLEITEWDLKRNMGLYVCCLPQYRIIDGKIAVFTPNSEDIIIYLLHGRTKAGKELWIMFSNKGKKTLRSHKLSRLLDIFRAWSYNELQRRWKEKHRYDYTKWHNFKDYTGRIWFYKNVGGGIVLKSQNGRNKFYQFSKEYLIPEGPDSTPLEVEEIKLQPREEVNTQYKRSAMDLAKFLQKKVNGVALTPEMKVTYSGYGIPPPFPDCVFQEPLDWLECLLWVVERTKKERTQKQLKVVKR